MCCVLIIIIIIISSYLASLTECECVANSLNVVFLSCVISHWWLCSFNLPQLLAQPFFRLTFDNVVTTGMKIVSFIFVSTECKYHCLLDVPQFLHTVLVLSHWLIVASHWKETLCQFCVSAYL